MIAAFRIGPAYPDELHSHLAWTLDHIPATPVLRPITSSITISLYVKKYIKAPPAQ